MAGCNLMPREFRDDYLRQVRLRFWLLAVAVVLLAGLAWVGWEFRAYRSADRDYEDAEKQQQGIRNQIDGLSNSENLLLQWQSELALQRRLGLYPHTVEMLSALVTDTPEKVYLSRLDMMPWQDECAEEEKKGPDMSSLPPVAQMFLRQNGAAPPAKPGGATQKSDPHEKKGGLLPEFLRGPFQLHLFGVAQNSDALADYLLALRSTGCFQTISLAELSRKIEDPRVMQFEIRCTLNRTGQRKDVDYAHMPTAENL